LAIFGVLLLGGCNKQINSWKEGEIVGRGSSPAESGVRHIPFVLPFPRGFVAGVVRTPYYVPEKYWIEVSNNTKTKFTSSTFYVPREIYEASEKSGTWFVPCSSSEYGRIVNSVEK